jgi:adenylate cyclase
MGYALERPILRLARATAAIRNFDLGSARQLGGSRLRELDEAISPDFSRELGASGL